MSIADFQRWCRTVHLALGVSSVDNEDQLVKLQAGPTGCDVIFPSDYMVAEMIELGLLAEIDVDQLSLDYSLNDNDTEREHLVTSPFLVRIAE